jgi:AcrR family transcriptional regulator
MPIDNELPCTPLSRELQGAARGRRAGPLDALKLARDIWLRSERVDIGAMAGELGVNKATLFRWIGSRERLLGEVIWSFFEPIWTEVVRESQGSGPDYLADLSNRTMEAILAAAPLRRFISQDPEFALRILTSKTSVVQARTVSSLSKVLSAQVEAGHIVPALAIEDLAYLIVRIVESYIYSDQITGRQPQIMIASEAIRLLMLAQRSPLPKKPETDQSKITEPLDVGLD